MSKVMIEKPPSALNIFTSLPSFQREIELWVGSKLDLKINDNRSTMLSVRWEPDRTKVSLHRMFLEAPKNIVEALASYIRKEHKVIAPSVKAFIEDNLKRLDYSHKLKKDKLYTQGTVYNLQEMYDAINAEYFDSKLKLAITWFGKPNQCGKNRVTFGLYYDPLKLIKINRLVDSPLFPDFFVSYVIYHEMLHYVCPSYVDANGVTHVHSKEFKRKESKFKYFELAQQWVKEHQTLFFK